MKSDELLDAIGEARDEYVHDVRNGKVKKMPRWAKWTSAIAACLVLTIGVSLFFGGMGGNAGGSGHEDGSTFMSYAGPVFPLTLRVENTSISANRRTTMDFEPWIPVWISNEEEAASRTDLTEAEKQDVLDTYNEWYPEGGRYQTSDNIIVTDTYTLSNNSTEDQTVSILYPFASSLNDLSMNRPTISVNDEIIDTKLHAGSYAGTFQGAWENWAETQENPGSLNLQYIESWTGYQTLLSDGSYLRRALGEYPDLSDIPVIVYTFTDPWGPEEDDDAGIPNPSMRIMFELDYEKTKVLSYGFHSASNDRENGIMGRGFSIREQGERWYDNPYFLIIIGDDVQNMSYQGYVTGGWDNDDKVEAGVTITRTESNLETALREAASFYYVEMTDMQNYVETDPEYGFEMYYGLLKEQLVAYGILSDSGVERYDTGWIEDLDVVGVDRVFWLEAEITIPAGESVTVFATFEKEPSFDFHCANTETKGISGYDMVTALGSNLRFTQQTACLEDRGQIEIVRQNFGFDIENGINEVALDMNEPHYYLEVKGNKSDK
ncbi:MAG: hypothetical protein IJB07_05850 [Firmicutes bacterium]|nr:hypothetical protein [Bacillota bacterium]